MTAVALALFVLHIRFVASHLIMFIKMLINLEDEMKNVPEQ